MTCLMCPTPLRPGQKCFCSYRCFRADSPSLRAMLDLFEATGDQWLTMSDLAIWLYGGGGESQRTCARTALWRLRQHGYDVEWRFATWDGPTARAYRLVGSSAWRTAA
jgi:hypothetical protein